MQSTLDGKIKKFRTWLTSQKIDAFILPHEDEYLNEYIPSCNERLSWLTGFTGSAGAAVITLNQAAIFVDGRYTVQVKEQAPKHIFEYQHLIQNPPIKWIIENLPAGSNIAIDPKMHSINWLQDLKEKLGEQFNLSFVETNPVDLVWEDRPKPQLSNIRLMPTNIAGFSSLDKRKDIAQKLEQESIDALLMTQLESICWILNIRGLDIPRLPVLLTHAIFYQDSSLDLFIDANRVPEDFLLHTGAKVKIYPVQEMTNQIASLKGLNVLLDPKTTNAWFEQKINTAGGFIQYADDPCALPKAAKNKVEAQGMQACHIKDGVAMVKFLCWLDDQVAAGNYADEAQLADRLELFRKEEETLVDLSFDTISAAGKNAAMCHYNHLNQTKCAKLTPNSLYLVDSGGQYINGTTDITRTIAIGQPSDFMRQQFTLVLKGHIALASAKFPQGTTGSQLDILARQFLWAHGYNFDHGTGHGVGHFLGVHEGPQRISPSYNNVALKAGMVLSNEPGYYQEEDAKNKKEGFGIRIENLEIVTQISTEGSKNTLGFTPLTRCPIDIRAIDKALLTTEEKNWLNQYHQKVWDDLHPYLDKDVKNWLEEATSLI